MTIHCFVTIITTFIETSSLRGLLGCFIAGYILNGPGQGVAFVEYACSNHILLLDLEDIKETRVYTGVLVTLMIRGKVYKIT